MKKTDIFKTVAYISLAAAILVLSIVSLKNNKQQTQTRIYQYDKEQALVVKTDTIENSTASYERSFAGIFDPNKETKISAELQGKINEIWVDVGSSVKKGQTLIQLDNSLLKLQSQSVEVQIEGLENDVKRYTILAKADAIQAVQLEKSQLALKAAKIQKETLLEQIKKTTIVSPFAGIVTAKLTEIGSFAAPGVPLLQITDISELRFTINIPENQLFLFDKNKSYSIKADAFLEDDFTANLILQSSKANMSNLFSLQFLVNNTLDMKIKSGMFGKLILSKQNDIQGIVLLSSVVVGTSLEPKVYLVQNGKALLQEVNIADRFDDKVVISSGLKAGDVIVTGGFINLYHQANVTLKNSKQ
jgi:RND family efflux transporter MFP subunit